MSEVIRIVESVIQGFTNKEERYTMLDEMHLTDDTTGFKFHLYDESFKITQNGKLVATSNDFIVTDRPVFLKLKGELHKQYAPIKEARVKEFITPYTA